MKRSLVLVALGTFILGGCAYYNSLYNAQRAFADAERAEERGDRATAAAAYARTIEKARRSLKRDDDGRWSDDAHYLLGRSHFGRGEYAAARVELAHVLAHSPDARLRAGAQAYLGAVEFQLGNPARGLELLTATLERPADDAVAAVAHLWRGRAHLQLGNAEAGLADLEQASRFGGATGLAARGERVSWAVRYGTVERARSAFTDLLASREAGRWVDSLRSFAAAAAARWSPLQAESMLASGAHEAWPATARDELGLLRAELLAAGGDTLRALETARGVAARSTTRTAGFARVAAARWQLARADSLADFGEVRNTLLPAIAVPEAQSLLRAMREVSLLVERSDVDPLTLFAAGEIARDLLGTPRVARELFISYAELVPTISYAGKALLAARALGPDARDDARIDSLLAGVTDRLYLAAGQDRTQASRFEVSEERLQRFLLALRQEASREAELQDGAVRTTIAQLDSARAAARRDSTDVSCGQLLDSLRIGGELGDSIRAACMRNERARVDSLIRSDTTTRARDRAFAPGIDARLLAAIFPPRRP